MANPLEISVPKNGFKRVNIDLPCIATGQTVDVSTVLITQFPSYGVLTIEEFSGKILYKPLEGYVGHDRFVYSVNDNLAVTCGEQAVVILVEDEAFVSIDNCVYCATEDASIKDNKGIEIKLGITNNPRLTCFSQDQLFEWESSLVFATKKEAELAMELLCTKKKVNVTGCSIPGFNPKTAFIEIPNRSVKFIACWWTFSIKLFECGEVVTEPLPPPVDPPIVIPAAIFKLLGDDIIGAEGVDVFNWPGQIGGIDANITTAPEPHPIDEIFLQQRGMRFKSDSEWMQIGPSPVSGSPLEYGACTLAFVMFPTYSNSADAWMIQKQGISLASHSHAIKLTNSPNGAANRLITHQGQLTGGNFSIQATVPWKQNQPHILVVTIGDGVQKLFLDDGSTPLAQSNQTGVLQVQTQPLRLHGGWVKYLQVKGWDIALSDEEVEQLFINLAAEHSIDIAPSPFPTYEFDPNDLALTDGQLVTQLRSKYHGLKIITAGGNPTFKENVLGVYPSIRFAVKADRMELGTNTGGGVQIERELMSVTGFTRFVVVIPTFSTGITDVWPYKSPEISHTNFTFDNGIRQQANGSSSGDSRFILFGNTGGNQWSLGGTKGPWVSGEPYVIAWVIDSGQQDLYINDSDTPLDSSAVVGTQIGNGNRLEFMSGGQTDLIFSCGFSSVLSPTEIKEKMDALKLKYGITNDYAGGATTTGLQVDYNASLEVYNTGTTAATNGQDISTWGNQAQVLFDAIQTNAANKMTYDDVTFGFPTVRALNSHMDMDAFLWPEGTFFIVCKPFDQSEIDQWRGLFGWQNNSTVFSTHYVQTDRDADGRMAFGPGPNAFTERVGNNWVIISGDFMDGGVANIYIGGRLMGTSVAGSASAQDPTLSGIIGRIYFSGSPIDAFNGWFTRVKFYANVMTPAEHAAEIASLLVDHPYVQSEQLSGVSVDWWLEATNRVYQDSGTNPSGYSTAVKSWSDKSGSGRGPFNSSAGASPIRSLTDGIDTVSFTPVNARLFHTYYKDFGTLFIVLKYTGTTSPAFISALGAPDNSGVGPSNYSVRVNTNHGGVQRIDMRMSALPTIVRDPYLHNDWYLIGYRQSDALGPELEIDGVVVATGAPGTRTKPVMIHNVMALIGGTYNNIARTESFDGHIAAIVAAERRMDNADFNAVTAALQLQYAPVL